ncbi:capsular biosynthesis protein [Cupriavidus gilardii]|uniref:capsular biosynthesis protein n=1 Tax=Cupriavidus gilardii TaxID=82541 RepID=UPI001EE5AE81|nr:capsular biosynthesis protein [Cupriavidus gilardii]
MSESPESLDAMLIVDIDGTLCDIKSPGQSYAELEPRRAIIEKLREYRERGYHIMLYTSRNMRTYNNNLGLINKHTAPVLLEWLARWDVPYDEILFGKPWPRHRGFYVDDRAIRPSEFLNMSEQEIQDLLARE